MHKYHNYVLRQSVVAAAFLCVLFFLPACGSVGLSSSLNVGEPKNSIPFFDKSRVEELRSIAVPPFEGGPSVWHTTAADILSSTGKVSVISSGKIDTVMKNRIKDLSDLKQEERLVFMARLGRTVQADAVLNGFFFRKNGRHEIILQLISAKDARILWWQAVDFSVTSDELSSADQHEVLSLLLTPLIKHLSGKKGGPPTPLRQEPSSSPAPKPEKKPDKGLQPLPLPDDISPM